jgi:hypothetical protein
LWRSWRSGLGSPHIFIILRWRWRIVTLHLRWV